MKDLKRNIDMVTTFDVGEPPEPHRFRIRDVNGKVHVVKIGQIFWILKVREPGYDYWRYKCRGELEGTERTFMIQFNVQKALWQLTEIA